MFFFVFRDDGEEEVKKSEELIVTGSMDSLVKVWDEKLNPRYQLDAHSFGIVSLDISSDSNRQYTSSNK